MKDILSIEFRDEAEKKVILEALKKVDE